MVQNLSGFTCQSRIDEALGAAVIREHVGRGNLDQQIILAHQMNVTVLMHLPSLVLQYFDRAAELGIDIKKSKLRLVIGAGEPWAESYRKKIEAEYGVIFRNIYGVAQAGELAGECEHDDGMHYNADLYFLEIIDPETKEVLELGEEGELVVTSFFRKAVPRIRYRTGDITKIMPYKPCPCGRTSPKISAVKGKLASLINVGEKRFFPIDVEEVIGSIPELGREYQIILDKPKEQERLKVNVEYKPEVKELAAVRSRVENQIGQSLGVESEVGLVPLGSIGRALFKAQRVVAKY
jgi:phenylacetate-CoA ligase